MPPESVAFLPSGFVTRTSAVPTACAGVLAGDRRGVTFVTVARAPPILTVAPAWKFVPVSVNVVPPAAEPVAGENAATVGAGRSAQEVRPSP